jgi:membrane protease YdiL (CAAX protease family)
MFIVKRPSKTLVLLEVILLLSGAPALALAGLIPFQYRWFPATAVIALATLRILSDRWSLGDLGIRPINIPEAVAHHLAVTVFSVLGLLLAATVLPFDYKPVPLTFSIVAFSLLVSFLQELIFRVFLIRNLKKHKFSNLAIIIISSGTFAFIHTFFEANRWFLILVCFFYGILMAELSLRHRNLLLLTLSHFVVNLMVVHMNLLGHLS